jgi:hypothetical protein
MTMSHPLYNETRSIFDGDNPNARWENNPEGFPAPDLGLGPDGKERDQFTERDIEILASNPITADAYIQDIISLYQVMRIGYKPLPILPTGLAQLAMHGAFREIGNRILSGQITVPEELKKKYAWIYELEHTAVQHDRERDQEDRSLDELEKRWTDFYRKIVGDHKNPAPDGNPEVLATLIEQFHADVESDMLAKYPNAYGQWPKSIWQSVIAAIIGTNTCAKEDVLAAREEIANKVR